jgi:hypothetical protein
MFRPGKEPLATALLQPPEINQALRKSYRLITIESLKGRISNGRRQRKNAE